MAEISIHLFGKPEWELGDACAPKDIQSKGNELKTRLYEIADAVQKLTANGWDCQMALYDLILYKSIPRAIALKELKKMGISQELCQLMDEEPDEEDA